MKPERIQSINTAKPDRLASIFWVIAEAIVKIFKVITTVEKENPDSDPESGQQTDD